MTDKIETPTALITGAGKGIGKATAVELAKNGIYVYINYLYDKVAALKTVEAIENFGQQAGLMPFNVTSPEESKRAVDQILDERGKIDILVNNAGLRDDRLFAMMKKPSWDKVIDTNLNGFYNVSKPVIKNMIKNRHGRIVNITSAAGQTGNAGQVNYSASKAGIIGATRALAREVGSRNITINAVSPGFIDTGMLEGLDREKIAASIPAGRIGTPEDVAHLVVFLCSKNASYINGQVIGVNGGLV